MKKLITLTALLCAMCVMFSCDNSSQPPVFKAGDDFAQAISELKSGETLFVSDDVELDAPLTIPAGKDIVIQLLGDSEIEYEGSGSAFVVEDGGSLVIKGPASGSGKSKKDGAAEGAVIESDGPVDSLITIGYGADVTLENITLKGENTENHSLIWLVSPDVESKAPETKLTLINVNATADKSIIAPFVHVKAIEGGCTAGDMCDHPMNAEIVIKGGSYTTTKYTKGAFNNHPLYFEGAKVSMEDVTVVSAGYAAVEIQGSRYSTMYHLFGGSFGTVDFGPSTIKNCTITNNVKAEDAGAVWHGAAVAASYTGEIVIEGGTYSGLCALATLSGSAPCDGKITCSGATLNGSEVESTKTDGDGEITIDGVEQ